MPSNGVAWDGYDWISTCETCGHEQVDMGAGVRCEECGSGPMPAHTEADEEGGGNAE